MSSIKDLTIRIMRRGKKCGRPSKYEVMMSNLMSEYVEENKKAIRKTIDDAVVFGMGIMYVPDNLKGKIKSVRLR